MLSQLSAQSHREVKSEIHRSALARNSDGFDGQSAEVLSIKANTVIYKAREAFAKAIGHGLCTHPSSQFHLSVKGANNSLAS
jgi:phosphopantetheinyl transferase